MAFTLNPVYSWLPLDDWLLSCRWLRLCVRSRWEEAVPLALKMATEQGRMKFTRPLFKYLYSTFTSHALFLSFCLFLGFSQFVFQCVTPDISPKYCSMYLAQCFSERCIISRSTETKRFQHFWLTEERCTQSPLA